MATRSNIGYVDNDGTIQASYCHWYGYPEGVGKVLLDNYDTLEMIQDLVAMGSMSSLGETLGTCVFHNRDKGEGLHLITYTNEQDMIAMQEEFAYLYK